MKKILKIEGMHCDGCAVNLKNLLDLKGYKVKVDFKSKQAELDVSNESDINEIKKEIEEVGYKVIT